MSQPGPPRSQPTRAWPTQHRPLWRTRPFKEPTVLEEASLTAAHLGPGWGGPGRGGFSLIVFRHQLWRLESQTAERGPEAPWSRARPQAVSHEGPSWDPPPWPLPVPAITVHQAPGLPPASGVWVLSKLHRGKQGGSSTPLHSPPPGPRALPGSELNPRFDAHGDPTHPAAFVQRKVEEQSGMRPRTASSSKSTGPELGRPGVQAQNCFCILVNSGQSLPKSGSSFLIKIRCGLF